jgi:hypothetical protein
MAISILAALKANNTAVSSMWPVKANEMKAIVIIIRNG